MSDTPVINVKPADRVRLGPLVPAVLGMTVRAAEHKIAAGKWVEGREYHRDPDGQIWVDVPGVQRWVVRG